MTGRAGSGGLRSIHLGVGGRGEHHVRNFLSHPAWRPVALVDTSPAALRAAAGLAGGEAACFDDVRQALRAVDADAAVVVTPSRFHVEHVRLALEAGLHVFVEKPFTQRLADAVELTALAEDRARSITVCQQRRFDPRARAVRHAVESGLVGQARFGSMVHHRHRPEVRAFTMPHAMIVEMSVHHFDDLRYWVGADATTVVARSFDPPWSGYTGGTVSALLSFANGAEIAYLGTFTSHADQFDLRLECDRGIVGWDSEGVYAARDGERTRLAVADGPSDDRRVIDELTAAVVDGRQGPVSARANLGTLAMVEAAIRSADTGLPASCGASWSER